MMDTLYIKMLQGAKEIYKREIVWFPRLDQLLDMVKELVEKDTTWDLVYCGGTDYGFWILDYKFRGDTPEQAILRCVMWLKCKKRWDNEKEVWYE